jgi:hypothetical protein
MPSSARDSPPRGEPEDDWDQVERWTRRIMRLAAIGVPSWLILLGVFNQNLTGIPWMAGFVMASMLATIITVVADRTATVGRRRRPLGPFARGLIIWAIVFGILAIVMSAGNATGAAVVLIPFLGATIVAGGVELARRALGGHR